MYNNIHSTFIHNGSKLEDTQMSTRKWINNDMFVEWNTKQTKRKEINYRYTQQHKWISQKSMLSERIQTERMHMKIKFNETNPWQ